MANPFITVLIPTRERCETLTAAIKTCVDQDYDDYQIIVADNCSNDQTPEVVTSFSDQRIRYLRAPHRLSMSANFDYALAQARPGYVVSLGDDDGLMPGAIQTVAGVIKKTGAKAVTSSAVLYHWPSFPQESMRNLLVIRDDREGYRHIDPKREVRRRLAGYDPNLYVWGLPTIYRGFISTEIIQKAIKGNRYFHSVTPDAYSAFVNSLFLDDVLYIKKPLTIEGVSGRSNGASQIIGKDSREEASYLSENDIPIHSSVAYAPAPQIVLAEAFLQASAQFPALSNGISLDYSRICHIALDQTRGSNNEERVRNAVAQILAKHNIPRTQSMHLRVRAANAWGRFVRILHTHEIRVDQYGVTDVYQAAQFAHTVLCQSLPSGGRKGFALAGHKILTKLHFVPRS